MTKTKWITPSEALEIMTRQLPQCEPMALANWARDGNLRVEASGAFKSDLPELHIEVEPTQPFWDDFWYAFAKRGQAVWTTGDLTTQVEVDHREFEEWSVRGVRFLRNDLLKCIRMAKGEKEPAARADPFAVKRWANDFIKQVGLQRCTDRLISSEAKLRFSNARGAITTARNYLREERAKLLKTLPAHKI